MLLGFSDPVKVKTKKIVYENVFHARDPDTLEQLKELSCRRKSIEDSINGKSNLTEAIAREMSGGLTSKIQRELQKLEIYLPLLENLVVHVELPHNSSTMQRWMSELKIQWSSALCGSSTFFTGSKFFRIKNLRFELGMSTYLYGAFLRERAFEILSEDLVSSGALFKTAAGVYEYLAYDALLPLESISTSERPPEIASSMSFIMSLICLADAQAVYAKKAQEMKVSAGSLSKLHYGITQMLNEAASALRSSVGELHDVSSKLVEFVSSCSFLYQLRSQRYFAEDLRSKVLAGNANGQLGVSIVVLRKAMASTRIVKPPKDGTWLSTFRDEVHCTGEMLRKFEHDNDFIYHERLPYDDQIPVLEGRRVVEPIPYKPARLGRQLEFQV